MNNGNLFNAQLSVQTVPSVNKNSGYKMSYTKCLYTKTSLENKGLFHSYDSSCMECLAKRKQI